MRRIGISVCIIAVFVLGACERTVQTTNVEQEPATCFNCHSDENTALVAAELQWEHSQHGSSENTNRSTSSCNYCHTSEGFKSLLETGEVPDQVANPTAIHCFTCHAPHTNGDFSLRVEDPQPLLNGFTFNLDAGNLCVACHHARENVNTYVKTQSGSVSIANNRWGPHLSVQGDMLLGSNGYEYTGYAYDQTEHRTATQDGCVDCHQKFTRNSKVGGHTWNMRWSDVDGDIALTEACVPCHGTTADFDISGVQTELIGLADQLRTLLVGRGFISDTTGAPIAGTRTSDEAGAIWNFLLFEEDRSNGVHNPNYMRGLLQSSIDFLNTLTAPVARASSSL